MLVTTEAGGASTDLWDRLAPRYRSQEWLEARSIGALLAAVSVEDDEVMLDVGTGTGHVLRRLTAGGRPAHAPTVASDRSAPMLALVPGPRNRVLRADAARLPLADGSVDVVTAAWLLHVLQPTARARAVAEVARVLRPGGRFGVVVPAPPRTPLQRLVRAAALRATTGLPVYRVPDGLPDLLAEHGLHVRQRQRRGLGYLADVLVATRGLS